LTRNGVLRNKENHHCDKVNFPETIAIMLKAKKG